MSITRYTRSESQGHDDILSQLESRVFHVTKSEYLESILKDGEIKTNGTGELSTTFGSSSNAYFRKMGCVSVFDYRAPLSADIEFHRSKCDPLMRARDCGPGVAILFLDSNAWDSLVPYEQSRLDGKSNEMVVPYVEAGYPGPIPIELIEEIICVKLVEDPSCLAAVLRAAHNAPR